MPPKSIFPLRAMPQGERPRERLMRYGARTLSNAELLAIILRTGSAQQNVLHLAEGVLARFEGLAGLEQASYAQLQEISGLGDAKIMQILALIELAHRLNNRPQEHRPQISTAADAAALVMDMSYLTQEHIRVILLDTSRRVVAMPTVYIGTLQTSILRVAELFREAITRNSPALILVHNHPSGDPSPSPEDIELTRTIIAAGELLDIQVIDHLIIGQRDWRSLKSMGLAFS
jgi:DNA repair protein RadC